jgi:hypothetical protein
VKDSDIPFVLQHRTRIGPTPAPGLDQRFDAKAQLWVSVVSGDPIVSEHVVRRQYQKLQASDLGETLLTKTSEGHDQSERLSASEFGETVMTRTAEGTDQHEGCPAEFFDAAMTVEERGQDGMLIRASKFGETLVTETQEGVDQSERIA